MRQPTVALVARRGDSPTIGLCRAHRASWLAHVPAILKAALAGKSGYLEKAERAWLQMIQRGREVAHARRVDQLSSRRNGVHAGCRGRVAPSTIAEEPAGDSSGIRDETRKERGFPGPRLSNQHTAKPRAGCKNRLHS